jgi:hypothetical protein
MHSLITQARIRRPGTTATALKYNAPKQQTSNIKQQTKTSAIRIINNCGCICICVDAAIEQYKQNDHDLA